MSRHQQRSAKSHPQDLHEVADVTVGWETLGRVGRFKDAKTWFAAAPMQHKGEVYFAWYADRLTSRAQAEQHVMNMWCDMWCDRIRSEAKIEARKEFAKRIHEAEDRANNAEIKSREDVLESLGYVDLTEMLGRHLEESASGHSYAREHVTGELIKYIAAHLDNHLGEAEVAALARSVGLRLVDDQDGVLAHGSAVDLANSIGDDWALFKDVERVRHWLNDLGQLVRYECHGSVLV